MLESLVLRKVVVCFETQKKVPLEVREGETFVLLFEIEIATGRSRSSLYRDMKAVGIKPTTLIKRKIPIVYIDQLWKFVDCPWFSKYADSVRESKEEQQSQTQDLEAILNKLTPITKLLTCGFSMQNLLDLAETGFLPCIKVPGNYLCDRRLVSTIAFTKKLQRTN